MNSKSKGFGTAPVFFTAISTILGAILFLRFGFAVGTLGFWGVLGIILLGHLVTIPTALAISEIATNKRVEGGGEYFIISRSFGLNIGATIGIALYMSQAISVAFYIIAFTEAFAFLFDFAQDKYGFELPRQVISIPATFGLAILIIKKGANVGLKKSCQIDSAGYYRGNNCRNDHLRIYHLQTCIISQCRGPGWRTAYYGQDCTRWGCDHSSGIGSLNHLICIGIHYGGPPDIAGTCKR